MKSNGYFYFCYLDYFKMIFLSFILFINIFKQLTFGINKFSKHYTQNLKIIIINFIDIIMFFFSNYIKFDEKSYNGISICIPHTD